MIFHYVQESPEVLNSFDNMVDISSWCVVDRKGIWEVQLNIQTNLSFDLITLNTLTCWSALDGLSRLTQLADIAGDNFKCYTTVISRHMYNLVVIAQAMTWGCTADKPLLAQMIHNLSISVTRIHATKVPYFHISLCFHDKILLLHFENDDQLKCFQYGYSLLLHHPPPPPPPPPPPAKKTKKYCTLLILFNIVGEYSNEMECST